MFGKGNNGLSGFNFGPSQFQNLLFLAGYDPSQPPYTASCGSDTGCVLPFMGRVRDGKFSDAPLSAHAPLIRHLLRSQLHRAADKWNQLCAAGRCSSARRRLGRLRTVEAGRFLDK